MPGLDTLFQKGEERTMEIEGIDNPYDLDFSFNLTFADSSKINTTASSNVTVAGGQVSVASGNSAVLISKVKNATVDVSKVQVKITGEDLGNVSAKVSADGGNTYQNVTVGELANLSSSGRNLILKLELNSSTARISSAAVLYT